MELADRMGRLGTESAFEVLARARALEAAGVDVVHLEIGEPDAAALRRGLDRIGRVATELRAPERRLTRRARPRRPAAVAWPCGGGWPARPASRPRG